jgi:5-methylcytosine-specific restriction endonuclease McrA
MNSVLTIVKEKEDILNIIKKKRNQRRFRVFHNKGLACVEWGVEINDSIYRKETYGKKHWDLVHMFPNKATVLMTIDHIYPLCLGGKRELNNEQPMCELCNAKKDNKPYALVLA